ncbi:hypothetical protein [Algoriphagus namhaensis]
MIKTLDDLVPSFKLISLSLISLSVLLRFDFLFAGANRYIPFRVIILLTVVWMILGVLPFFKSKLLQKEDWYFLISFLSFFLLAHFFWLDQMNDVSAFFRNQFHFLYILSGFFLTRFFCAGLSDTQVKRVVKMTIIGAIVVGFLESFFRFTMPTLDLNSESTEYLLEIYEGAQTGLSFESFYFFKMSSIMFFDSNYVGTFLLVFLALHLLSSYSSRWIKVGMTSILFLLICLTLSRAAMLVGVALISFFIWKDWALKSKWLLVLLSLFLSVSLLLFVQDNVSFSDGSFITKLQILEGLSNYFDQDLSVALMGMGYEVGGYLYSYMSGGYAHIHLAILLGELGLLGTLVYFGYWYFIRVKQGVKVLYIFIPFLIVGFSLADPWEISYFWACGLINRI